MVSFEFVFYLLLGLVWGGVVLFLVCLFKFVLLWGLGLEVVDLLRGRCVDESFRVVFLKLGIYYGCGGVCGFVGGECFWGRGWGCWKWLDVDGCLLFKWLMGRRSLSFGGVVGW